MGQKLAFIGLGVMGYPMAGHLANAGHEVTVYNRTAAKADAWVRDYDGTAAATPAEAATDADAVFACVGNDEHLRAVTLGAEGAFDAMKAGAVFIDHTTASAAIARDLAEEAGKRGIHFLDAPVSGGQAGAENGALTVMVGGEPDAFARVESLIHHFAKFVKLLGPAGSGQLAKMVNQICIAGTVQGLSEALHFAESAGIDAAAVIDVISHGAAQSWQMDNRAATMIEGKFDYGFAVDWMRKDLGIALDEARRNGAHLPVAALVDQFYGEVQSLGGSLWDTSSLIARLRAVSQSKG